MSSISDNIKYYRTKLSLTQAQLADKLNVSEQAVYNWERGTRIPRMGYIEKMAALFDVESSDILKVTDTSTTSSTTVADLNSPILALDGHKITGEEADNIRRYAHFLMQDKKEKKQKNTNSDD